MNDATQSPLGRETAYSSRYDPGLLFPIPRAPNRAALGIHGAPPFGGVDIWNAYELSWLDPRGVPKVALGEFRVPADSTNLVESKSLKLYLNGFSQERITGIGELQPRIAADLSRAAGAAVVVALREASASGPAASPGALEGRSIDDAGIDVDHYGPPQAGFLGVLPGAEVEEALVSDLLKSNCPVTGQPDWASLWIRYRGRRIDPAGLLRYVVSFREHSGFHEDCVERIFIDLMQRCAPRQLTVYARYTRRGGLDINPWRSSDALAPAPNVRLPRQ
ncbi:MAG: NADPH-dependent 7-cyano-7-deazaguanine reductase QueF [Xanthomonadales bacterium]|nr:NADPH-dependent 7-cyano-7-deazaguanine reductase QueF [Xanthomonadales bacterium]